MPKNIMPVGEPSAATRPEDVQPARDTLKTLLRAKDPAFWDLLRAQSLACNSFDDAFYLSALRKKAAVAGLAADASRRRPLKLAILSGSSIYPLSDLVEHFLFLAGYAVETFAGKYDNYVAEIMDGESDLYRFQPEVVLLLPALRRCSYSGRLWDTRQDQQAEVMQTCSQVLSLCELVHERSKAEVLLGNFILPAGFDPGQYRSRTLGSPWTFRKAVNLELGLNAPPYVHICDLEFLAYRRGGLASRDDRAWCESKQPGAPDLQVDIAREVVCLVDSLRKGPKKVLVLDLDNTLWGGVIGDDGLEGIEIGDTSPAGEAFKAFQKSVLSLCERGVLLAVCSKNDAPKAMEPFLKHPEMVLRLEHFAAFKANWNPKPDNIRQIAAELNLGLDSFVFVDDNPAEIEIVRQFVPEVATLLAGPDPADYVRQLEDARFFEPHTITQDDASRTGQYRQEAQRKALLETATDIGSYLRSLEMKAVFREFTALDAPRIAQLINKSNQFNLTTRRRTEAEVLDVVADPAYAAFSVRLTDRFGDHGLIAVVIGRVDTAATLSVDTWLMSCRVLNRQVEEETINELVRLAASRSCRCVRGVYLPTEKNGMVRELYPRVGFQLISERNEAVEYMLEVEAFQRFSTHIFVERRAYETTGSNRAVAADIR